MSSRFTFTRKAELNLSRFLQMKITPWLCRCLPFAVSRFFVTVLGHIYYLCHPQEKALIREAIRRVFRGRLAAGELRKKVAETLRGSFDHYHEKLFVGYTPFPNLLQTLRKHVRFGGLELLREVQAAGRGVILVTGHFGAVEMLPGALAVNGLPAAMICRFKTTRLREAQGRRAAWLGVDLIDTDKGQSFFAAAQSLKEGRILITECDEFEAWRPDALRKTRFLSHRLRADRTLELLQRRSGAPVVTALVRRTGPGQYLCELSSVSRPPAPVNLPLSEQCLRLLESAVQAYPEQWYQWPIFAKMTQTLPEAEHDHPASGYLAPAFNLPLPYQA